MRVKVSSGVSESFNVQLKKGPSNLSRLAAEMLIHRDRGHTGYRVKFRRVFLKAMEKTLDHSVDEESVIFLFCR